jgi:phosphatidylinositol glycan class M
MLRWPSFRTFLILSFVLRVVLIIYSEYYDALPTTIVKYTDIDYVVFSDAARYLVNPNATEGNLASGVLGKKLGLGE